ncbi:hypothetical protein V1514DRAFT_68315 [Lipomyces japonicus]|uniref:uncharacterized protein n=1 Tax=Lipomyces japonicus TaxID=56871 RepID=UPI0034CE5C71
MFPSPDAVSSSGVRAQHQQQPQQPQQPHVLRRAQSRHFETFNNVMKAPVLNNNSHAGSNVVNAIAGNGYDYDLGAFTNEPYFGQQPSYIGEDTRYDAQRMSGTLNGSYAYDQSWMPIPQQQPVKQRSPTLRWMESPPLITDLNLARSSIPSAYSPPGSLSPAKSDVSMGSSFTLPSRGSQQEDEFISTAIVIKNIPFNIGREQLLDIMVNLGLSLPYALNFHTDNAGVFRGLAFANFTSANDTARAIVMMNGFEVHGRRLRVEYKKLLPASERERVEREKRSKRGQLEEQHRNSSFFYPQKHVNNFKPQLADENKHPLDVDLNDQRTLEIYSEILLFQNSPEAGNELVFARDMNPIHRRAVQVIAQNLRLSHSLHGEGDTRYVVVSRKSPSGLSLVPGPGAASSGSSTPGMRSVFAPHPINSAAVPSSTASAILDMPPSSSLFATMKSGNMARSLRGTKSFADIRSTARASVHGGGNGLYSIGRNGSTASLASNSSLGPGSNGNGGPPGLPRIPSSASLRESFSNSNVSLRGSSIFDQMPLSSLSSPFTTPSNLATEQRRRLQRVSTRSVQDLKLQKDILVE